MLKQRIMMWFTPASDSGVADDLRRGKSPWADSIHLMWSAWIFITPFFDRGFSGYTLTWLIYTLVTYPIFLLLFAKAQLAPRRTSHFYPFAIVVLSLATLRWYPSGLTYLIFGCIMLQHYCVRFHAYLRLLVLINALYVLLAWWIGYPWQMWVSIPVVVFIVCTIVAVEETGKQRDAALRLSQEEVRRLAATAERERIGRDLHDLLGHTLSLITLKLELSRKLFDRDPGASKQELEEAEKVARHALAEVRSAVTGIRSTDLAAELASARLLLESSGVHLDYDALPPSLPADIEKGLALVIREALTNVHRHAAASEAYVRFDTITEKLDMQICDNGRGGVSDEGNGISGMRERIRAIGGTWSMNSPAGRGTRIQISVPLTSRRGLPYADPPASSALPTGLARGAA